MRYGTGLVAFSLIWATAGPLAGAAPASEPPVRITIGGPGTCSSEGFDDPGRLSDGITEAAASFSFVLDANASTLTLTIENTSPVLTGIPNPVLTDAYFNCPVEITGMSLVSQSSAGGVTPAFGWSFDADTSSNPNPNGANGFGAFSAALENPGGIAGAIANASADTLPAPPGSLAIGPATFVFSLTGDLTNVETKDFATLYSTTPPGNKPSQGVAKFQGGGVAGASAFISNRVAECFLIVSPLPGNDSFVSPMPGGHVFQTYLGAMSSYHGITIDNDTLLPIQPMSPVAPRARFLSGGVDQPGLVSVPIQRFFVQALLWNPDDIPLHPEQTSTGIEIWSYANGLVRAFPYGSADGIAMTVETYTTSDGRRFLRFPFTVDTP